MADNVLPRRSIIQRKPSVEPATPMMLEAYKTWLHYEQRFLCWEMAQDPAIYGVLYPGLLKELNLKQRYYSLESKFSYVGQSGSYHKGDNKAADRAALVLSTVGCNWREND